MRVEKSTKPTPREAVAQAQDEKWQCLTCSGVAQEHSDYCVSCEIYWQDCDEMAVGEMDECA